MRKINRKGQVGTIGVVIISLLVLAIVLGGIFRADIYRYVKNLPSYSIVTPEDSDLTKLSDAEVKNLYGEKVGNVERTDRYFYLYYDGAKTDIYLEDNLIYFDVSGWGNDLEIGKVTDGILIFNSDLFNADSELFNQLRLYAPSNFWEIASKFSGAKVLSGNVIYKKYSGEEFSTSIPSPFSEEEIIKLDTEIDTKKTKGGNLIIDLPGVVLNSYGSQDEVNWLYLVEQNSYIEIRGYNSNALMIDWRGLGRIYPSGEIVLSQKLIKESTGITFSSTIKTKETSNMEGAYLTNLRINYAEVLKKLNEK
jgi:hypothetical protein